MAGWLDKVIVVGDIVDGMATVSIPLPGGNPLKVSDFRNGVVNASLFESDDPIDDTVPPDNSFILATTNW